MGGEGKKRSLGEATEIACGIVSELDPACDRIEVAGSIRRKRLEVGDIEIVVQPKMKIAGQQTLFGLTEGKRVSMLRHHLEVMIAEGHLMKHPTDPKMGERYMKLWRPIPDATSNNINGISVDIFAVLPPANWGVIFTLRTGGKEFNLWIVEQARKKGLVFREGQLLKGTWEVRCPEEQDVFKAIGIPWIPPLYRSPGPEQRF
jgi:DNA polymerase/3'-5' exonuclease PolX